MSNIASVAAEPTTIRKSPWSAGRALPEWLVVLGALVLALVVTGGLLQVVHPFIRHDDWACTLGRHEPGSSGQFARNLYEGRWLNTVYWYVVGQRTSIVVASMVFVVSYSAFVWGFVRALAPPSRLSTFVLTFAVFVSAIWVRLIYWPGTLSASMIVAAVAVVVAYRVGILVVYAFNWLAFGTFGLTISAWRRPNPLESLEDLTENLARYGTQFTSLLGVLGWAAVAAVISLVRALVDSSTRRAAVIVLGAVIVVVALEGGLTVYSGVVAGARASLWAWPAVCLPAALLLKGIRPSRIAGVVALAVIASVGTLTRRTDLGAHQQTRDQYDVIVNDTAAVVGQHPEDEVVMWLEPRWTAMAQAP